MDKKALAEAVDGWLSKHEPDDEIRNLLRLSLGRILVKTGDDKFERQNRGLPALRLWLTEARSNDAPWLRNVDELGRPKKLMKLGSLEALLKEAAKAWRIGCQKWAGIQITEEDEELVATLEDGYGLVRLKSRDAFFRESGILQNCLAHDEYLRNHEARDYEYLVLKDRLGKSHVAIEKQAHGKWAFQVKGKQNAAPAAKYGQVLARFFAANDISVVQFWKNQRFFTTDGRYVATQDLYEDHVIVAGDLIIDGVQAFPMPGDLRVTGDLKIRNCSIESPSDYITVGGTLHISDSSGEAFAQEDEAGRVILLETAQIRTLPQKLRIKGHLDMTDNRHVETMPAVLDVGGWICATNTAFRSFGRSTRAGLFVSLQGAETEYEVGYNGAGRILQPGDIVLVTATKKGLYGYDVSDFAGRVGTISHFYSQNSCAVEFFEEENLKGEMAAFPIDCLSVLPGATPEDRPHWSFDDDTLTISSDKFHFELILEADWQK